MKKHSRKLFFLLLGILQLYRLEAAVPAPTLNSPLNGAMNVNPRFTIAVNDMSGVTSFQYELNTDPNFASDNTDKYIANVTPANWYTGSVAGINSDYFFSNAGKFGKTYYLRVKAFNSNTAEESAWSNVRTFTTVSSPTLTSPSNSANLFTRFTVAVNPMIGITSYQYEINTDANFAADNVDKYIGNVSPANWYTGLVSGVNSDYFFSNAGKFGKTYYLRVRAFNTDGGTDPSEWSNVRTFTTVTAPTLTYPANETSNVNTRFTIAVGPMIGITSYQYEINTDANFAADNADKYIGNVSPANWYTGLVSGVNSDYFFSNAGKFGKTYYLRVRAFNTDGGTDPSEWSNVRTFTTVTAPTLTYPANETSNVNPRFTIAVSPMSGITSYQYEINTDANFAADNGDKYIGNVSPANWYTGLVSGINSDYFFSTAGKFGKTYYLRVRAFNTDGGTDPSEWSNIRMFTTVSAPTLTSPLNDAANIHPRFTIAVSPMSGITSYEYEINTNVNFAPDNPDKYIAAVSPANWYTGSVAGINSDYFFCNAAKFGKTYYLRVRAYNTNGGTDPSAWSNVRTYSTITSIPLSSPGQDAISQSTAGFNLSWTDINGESGYEIQLSTSNLFTTTLINTSQAGVTKSTGGLAANTTYFWRVGGKVTISSVDYYSAWSERTFSTGANIITLPSTPVLTSPTNNSTSISTSPTLSWEEVTGASYQYEYSTDQNFITGVQSGLLPIGTTNLDLTSLPTGTKYHWRIRSIISDMGSTWSTPFNFTTMGIPVTVSISDNGYIYDGTAKAVTITTDPVSIAHTVTYTLAGSPISTPTNGGTYDVLVTITDPLYSLSGSGSGTLTISKKVLSATADAKVKNYGDQNPALTFQYSGFVGDETASVIDTQPSISTSATQFSNVGNFPITLANGSDNNYSFSFTGATLTVNKASLTVSADAKSKVYGEDNPVLTFQYTGLLGGDDLNDIDTPPSIGSTATKFSDVGSYAITLTGGTDNNYELALENNTLSITKASLNVSADEKSKVYGQQNPALTFQYSGFLGDDNSSDLDQTPIVSTNALQFSNAGAYAITFSDGVDNNYALNYNNSILTISKATLTASAASKIKVYGQPNPLLTFEYSGFLGDDTANEIDDVPTIETAATQFSNVGSYPIEITGGSDNNYQFEFINNTLTITKATINVVAENKTKRYGEPNPTLTFSYDGLLGSDESNDINVAPTISTNAQQNSDVATYPITLTGGSDDNYNLSLSNGTLTVNKADQEITFDPLPVKNVNDGDFSITANASSQLTVTFQSSNPSVATVSGNTISIHATGSTEISAMQNGTTNYNAAQTVIQLLQVKQDQIISFPAIPDKTIGDESFALNATSPAGEEIIYTPSNNHITIIGNQVTLNTAGSVTITANQPGNSLFFPAEPVANTFCIKPAKPTIELQSSFPVSVLSSSASAGIQWFRNGTPIEGETAPTLSTTESGLYAVVSTIEGCTSELSDNYDLLVTALETSMNSKLKVYPTITEDQLTIHLQYESSSTKKFTIYNPMGVGMIQKSTNSKSTELSVKELPNGIYFLVMRDGSGTAVVRFIKK